MTRHPLRPAALTTTLAALCFLAAPLVGAQDRASVGGGSDPALIGGYSMPAANPAPTSTSNVSQASLQREDSIEEVEDLLSRLQSDIGGTAAEAPRGNEPPGTDRRGREVGTTLRYRNEVETMVRQHWDQLAPLTRDLYSANYDRSNPDDNSRRYRSPYGDNGQMENTLLGATDDVQGAMQNLEDLLLPMLKDLKQGFDNGLQQRAIRR